MTLSCFSEMMILISVAFIPRQLEEWNVQKNYPAKMGDILCHY